MKTLALAGALALALTAGAFADPVRIDFTQPLVIDGSPLIDDVKCPVPINEATGRPTGAPRPCDTKITLGDAVYNMLERPFEHESWTDAKKHDELANAVRKSKDWPLLEADKIIIEAAFGSANPPIAPSVIGAVARVLDAPAPAPAPEPAK